MKFWNMLKENPSLPLWFFSVKRWNEPIKLSKNIYKALLSIQPAWIILILLFGGPQGRQHVLKFGGVLALFFQEDGSQI